MPKFQLNKIVRDKLVLERAKIDGIKVNYISLHGEEAILELFNKLGEEFEELQNEQDNQKRIEELGDIQTVVNTLYKELGYSKDEFDSIVAQKKEKRGGFDQKLYVHNMEVSENNKLYNYFKSDPEKYPEISE